MKKITMSKMKKELHLAQSIEELNRLVTKNFKDVKPDKLINSAETLFKHGLQSLHDGDEETAYIFFYRFYIIYNYLEKKFEKTYIKRRIGNEYNTVVEQIAKLRVSLTQRYSLQKANNEIPTKIIEETSKEIPSEGTVHFSGEYIQVNQVYELIKKKIDIVILDTRPSDDYKESSMKYPHCVNIPEEIIQSGKSANTLGKLIPEDSKSQWDRRWTVSVTILLDWSSDGDTFAVSKLNIFRDILLQWDTARNQKCPVILSGGYLELLQTYPMLCTNPDVLYKVQNTVLNDILDLDTVIYPTAEESRPARVFKPPTLQPIIDRATKPVSQTNHIIPPPPSKEYINDDEKGDVDLKQIKQNQNLEDLKIKRNLDIEEEMRLEQKRDDPVSKDVTTLDNKKQEFNENNEAIKKKMQEMNLDIDSDNTRVTNDNDAGMRERLLQEAREKKKNLIISKTNSIVGYSRHDEGIPPVINRGSKPISRRTDCGETGMKNYGSTCYMNSVVQCLSNTRIIHEYYTILIANADNSSINGQMNAAFHDTMARLWNGNNKAFLPSTLKGVVNHYGPKYNNRDHQDAHEFLISLCSWLHDDLKTDISLQQHEFLTPREKSWILQTDGKYSIIIDTFCGQIKNTLNCIECDKRKEKYEIFENLSLGLPVADNCTLEACLDQYFSKQLIADYKCPKCKVNKGVNLQLKLVAEAPVLVLVLKRFSGVFDKVTMTFRKNNIPVKYPMENLRFDKILYNLYGVVVHRGELDRGHYWAVCKNVRNGRWYKYDDDRVTSATKDDILNFDDAYILFYQKHEEEEKAKQQFYRSI